MPKKLKELVDAITDELALQPDVAACYQVWNDLRDKLEGYYKDKPRVHNPLSKQKEFKAIKNSIIREADRLRLELEQEEIASTNPYTNEESGEIDSTETPPKTDSAQQPIKSPAVNNHNPAVIAAVTSFSSITWVKFFVTMQWHLLVRWAFELIPSAGKS